MRATTSYQLSAVNYQLSMGGAARMTRSVVRLPKGGLYVDNAKKLTADS